MSERDSEPCFGGTCCERGCTHGGTMRDEHEFNVKAPKTDAGKMDEYVRRLRQAWLNPSDEASQMAVHNFENRIAPEFVRGVLERIAR